MELLETQDPEKRKLIESSERHKRALEKEVNALTGKTERMLTNALIIGASLALTYFVISSLSGGKKKKKKKAKAPDFLPAGRQAPATSGEQVVEDEEEEDDGPSIISEIGKRVLNQATGILLEIAKEKLAEYLESRKKSE